MAKAAVDAGASIINDISALHMDPEMASIAARCRVPLILMHIKGTPRNMQVNPTYDDLLGEVRRFLEEAVAKAVAAGVDPGMIVIDPGIGFGKALKHNLALINRLSYFSTMNLPILVGPSRKTFIRKLLATSSAGEPTTDSPAVETGTQAAVAASIMNGAHMVRVHNVANTIATVRILDAIRKAG